MVDRCLGFPLVDSEVQDYSKCAAKAGWSVIPGGFKEFASVFPLDKSVAVDKKLWDWTVPAWVVFLYFLVKMAQVRNPSPAYRRALFNRFSEIWGPDAVVRLPTGMEIRQLVWGIMKSGCYFTTSCNSMAQDGQHILAWIRAKLPGGPALIWSMGDDVIMLWKLEKALLDGYLSKLATTGCIVKHAVWRREFAGFEVTGVRGEEVVKPLYPLKHQFMLRYVDPALEQQVLMQFAMLNALDKDSWFNSVKEQCRFPVGEHFRQWALGNMRLEALGAVWTQFAP